MNNNYFKEGGPYNLKNTDSDHITMEIPFTLDPDGRIARNCPNNNCHPGYFKVKIGTGITNKQEYIYCPYCHHKETPGAYLSPEQKRYSTEAILSTMGEAVSNLLQEMCNQGPLSYKKASNPSPRRPFEEDIQRDIICPHCSLDHSVFGLATWCSDCGRDIFLSHVEAEINVLRIILSDVERRRVNLGKRVAAKDLENCLEDTVSIFEAVLRAEAKRQLSRSNVGQNDVEIFFKKTGNAFQNIRRAEKIFNEEFGILLLNSLSDTDICIFIKTFEKRHLISHNLGVVDKKYIERAQASEKEGREVLVNAEEIEASFGLMMKIFRSIHNIDEGNSGDRENA